VTRRLSGAAALRVALGVSASGLVFGLILRFIAKSGVEPLAALHTSWALGAVVLTTIEIAVVALRWAFFARELGAGLAYETALGAYYVSVFLNQLLPLGVLGDAFRGLWHARRLNADAARGLDGSLVSEPASTARPALDAATALILDRASGQITLLVLVLPVLPLWWAPLRAAAHDSGPAFGPFAVLSALFAALGIAVVFAYFWRSALRNTARARRIFFRPRAVAVHGGWSAFAVLLHVAAFCCAARALGFALPFGVAMRVVPPVLVASMLPSFAFGTGAREASAAALYHLLGLHAAAGAEIALALGLLGFVASWPGLLVLVLARMRARAMR
jgi:glycosyltransferase 2 family protein